MLQNINSIILNYQFNMLPPIKVLSPELLLALLANPPFPPPSVDFVFLRKLVCQVRYQISLASSSPFLHERRAQQQLAQPLEEKVKRQIEGQFGKRKKE